MHPKHAEEIANSVDPDQTAPLGAVWLGSTLFAQTGLSKNLGSLRLTLSCMPNKISDHRKEREHKNSKFW